MVTIKTETLQNMVNKAVRGASNNKLIPLTSYIGITLSPNIFSLLTTDGMNYLQVSTDIEGEPLKAVVLADVFAKLVRKLTGDTVKLDLTDKYLVVECNGTYKLELLLDEEGNPIEFHMPSDFDNFEGKPRLGEFDRSTITRIMNSLKQSLAVVPTRPHYCCYRMGDEIVATDTSLISILNKKVFEKARLLSAECMNLLDVVVDEGGSAVAYQLNGAVVFDCGHDILYTREPNGLENFNVDAIKGFADGEFPYHCTISKQSLIDTFERIDLFVGDLDAGAVNLKFDQDGVTVSSKSTSGVEQVQYETVDGETSFECVADVTSLLTVFRAQPSDVVDVYFGAEQTIKVVDGDLVTIFALMV